MNPCESVKDGKNIEPGFFFTCCVGSVKVLLLLPDVVFLVFMVIMVTRTFKAQAVARCVNEHLQARDC